MKDSYINFITIYSYVLMFLYGCTIVMTGTLIPVWIKIYEINLSKVGLLFTIQSLGGLLAIFLVSFFSFKVKKIIIIITSFFLTGFCLFFIGKTEKFFFMTIIFLFCGIFTRTLDIYLNSFIGDIHYQKSGTYLNRLHMFFGLGAFSGPIFAGSILTFKINWNVIYFFIGLIYFVIFALGILNRKKLFFFPENTFKSDKDFYISFRLLKTYKFWILGLILFFYSFHQMSVSAWIPFYMENYHQNSKFISNFSNSLFWLGIIIGRLVVSFVIKHYNIRKLLFWSGFFGGSILIIGFLSNQNVLIMTSLYLTGFLSGSVIPLVYSLSYIIFQRKKEIITSFLSFFLLMGQMTGPWFFGLLSEKINIQNAIYLLGITLYGCTLIKYIDRKK